MPNSNQSDISQHELARKSDLDNNLREFIDYLEGWIQATPINPDIKPLPIDEGIQPSKKKLFPKSTQTDSPIDDGDDDVEPVYTCTCAPTADVLDINAIDQKGESFIGQNNPNPEDFSDQYFKQREIL